MEHIMGWSLPHTAVEKRVAQLASTLLPPSCSLSFQENGDASQSRCDMNILQVITSIKLWLHGKEKSLKPQCELRNGAERTCVRKTVGDPESAVSQKVSSMKTVFKKVKCSNM
jgi:hypothetical protein